MTLALDALTQEDAELARQWRNRPDMRPALRTPFLLTEHQQFDWYKTVVCDRRADSRWWAVRDHDRALLGGGYALVALAGLTGLQFENGLGEISLVVAPEFRAEGIGAKAVGLVLEEAFARLRLQTVFGEVYHANGEAVRFWRKQLEEWHGEAVTIPRRKFWGGNLWDAELFWFTVEAWRMHG